MCNDDQKGEGAVKKYRDYFHGELGRTRKLI